MDIELFKRVVKRGFIYLNGKAFYSNKLILMNGKKVNVVVFNDGNNIIGVFLGKCFYCEAYLADDAGLSPFARGAAEAIHRREHRQSPCIPMVRQSRLEFRLDCIESKLREIKWSLQQNKR